MPITKLGRLVKENKIKSLEDIYLFSMAIKGEWSEVKLRHTEVAGTPTPLLALVVCFYACHFRVYFFVLICIYPANRLTNERASQPTYMGNNTNIFFYCGIPRNGGGPAKETSLSRASGLSFGTAVKYCSRWSCGLLLSAVNGM